MKYKAVSQYFLCKLVPINSLYTLDRYNGHKNMKSVYNKISAIYRLECQKLKKTHKNTFC